jgi:rhodanese-related sulfurtransferase
MPVGTRSTIDDLLAEARRTYRRVTAMEAWEAMDGGAVLVDTRSPDQQLRQGHIPRAVHHPLSVLLWRLDPDCPTANPKLPLETTLILICREGSRPAWRCRSCGASASLGRPT